jgi:acetolactate synthase regulatory subunit
LAEADATIDTLQHDVSRLKEENAAMVLQIVEIFRELQEARDSKAEARMLRRQRVQMFRGFSARLMEAAHRLGIDGLNLPTISEDDGSILHFFSQLAEKLVDASTKVSELVDAECRELLGLAGTWIFSNIQRLRPDLSLEEVLQRIAPPPRAPLIARCKLGWLIWTSPSSACRPSTPAQGRPELWVRIAPPAATPQAPGSLAAKKPKKSATTE